MNAYNTVFSASKSKIDSSTMVLKCAIVLLLLAVTCSSSQEGKGLDYLQDEEFQSWISQYYRGGENLAEIYPTWRRNADFVKHQNTLGLSYTLSVNKFAHLVSLGSCIRTRHLYIIGT